MKKKLPKNRNPVAKYARKYNKAKVFLDRTKYNRRKDKKVELDDFIDDHKWEPFENYDPSFIWEQIEHLAYSVRNYIDQT